MNQGDSRKDQSGCFSRRRPQAFDLEESARNGNPFTPSIHPLPYSNSSTAPHRQPFSYWPPPGYPHVHHAGSIHRFPGHQMFTQRGPFGGENHQYRPVGFLPQFRIRFPEGSDHQQASMFTGDSRRTGYHCGRRHFEDTAKSRFDFGGPGCRERALKMDQVARTKSGKFPGFKMKVYKKKSNWNNSSNVSPPDGETDKVENKLRKKCKKNNESYQSKVVKEIASSCTQTVSSCTQTASSCTGASSSLKTDHSQTLDCDVAESCSTATFERNVSQRYFATSKSGHSANVNFSDEEGAVGGEVVDLCEDVQVADVSRLNGDRRLDSCSFDTNLIDEGAICDLDKMFQHQEFSHCGSDNSDDCLSDSDLKMCSGHAAEDMTTNSRKVNDDLLQSFSDDDSESENCSYVYNPQAAHSRQDVAGTEHIHCSHEATSSCSQKTNRHHFSDEKKVDVSCDGRLNSAVGNGYVGDSSDDGEDTGDFIDTDLPSHNKHILSSSDEMDNISSNSGSDHEGNKEPNVDYRNREIINAEFYCNDLSSAEPKVQNDLEALSIRESNDTLNTSLSSKFHNSGDLECFRASSSPLRRVTPCSSSSVSENGDSSILRRVTPSSSSSVSENGDSSILRRVTPSSSSSVSENGDNSILDSSHSPPNAAETSALPYVCYSSTSSCLDGAAASQVSSDVRQKLLDDPYNSCPPGAECEMPQASPSRVFFHSNMYCHGGRHESCSGLKPSQSPAGEHIAVTASSAPDPADTQMLKQELASCSASSQGGACCPPGYRLSQVNDLNACCHHNHIHVANGFNHDRPEANFNNDESNRHQKVFVKFPVEDKMDENGSHSASSCDLEDIDGFSTSGSRQDKSSDSGGSEDPLSHDSGDNVDMVLLPMEEEIEPVHHMGAGLCAGGVEENDEYYHDLQLATSGSLRGTNVSHLCEEHQYLCGHDQNPLRNGMPSKEFYDLIKTVSTTDSYMRFFDKDGQDVQRQPFAALDDGDDDDEATKQNVTVGGQSSKMERLKVDRVMIWNEYEAYVMQFKQIAVSACGQTAVLNVLKALKFNCEKSAVCKVIQSSLRKKDACIPEYLFSRAKAGTTAEELMLGVEKLSGGAVGSRFFPFWPPRKVKLLQWLAYWMKRGAIPIATLNLQQGPHSLWQVPDSWHHQMVYGVSHQGLYLTNPLEIVSERSAMKQLCSDSVLMVRRQDIISRFRETTDLSQLLTLPDPRWRTMNVLGQVVNVLREFNMPSVPGYRLQVTSHISIPASYKAGVTLFMTKDKSAWSTLMNAPEIPIQE